MPDYVTLKLVHQACAVVSLTGFMLRWAMALAGSPWVTTRLVRTVPHVVDTLLLASAVAMAWQLGAGPWSAGWLPAKLVALAAYVGLGTLALRRARTTTGRLVAGLAAIGTFGYIVSVAITKSPWGLLAALAR